MSLARGYAYGQSSPELSFSPTPATRLRPCSIKSVRLFDSGARLGYERARHLFTVGPWLIPAHITVLHYGPRGGGAAMRLFACCENLKGFRRQQILHEDVVWMICPRGFENRKAQADTGWLRLGVGEGEKRKRYRVFHGNKIQTLIEPWGTGAVA